MDDLWDPERLRVVGSVLTRYADHLQPGHRIRLGMEGDPCSVYRSADEAPKATVLDVHREAHGLVRFRARLDDSHAVLDLDNRNVERVWEIDPDGLDAFRASVEAAERPPEEAQQAAWPSSPDPPPPPAVVDDAYRAALDDQFARLDERLREVERSERDARATTASAVRELAGDLMRAARGEAVEFAHRYADRYDLALAERVVDDDDDGFRAAGAHHHSSASPHRRSPSPHSDTDDRHSATVEPVHYAGGGEFLEADDHLSEEEPLR